jgi:hypothetical protein
MFIYLVAGDIFVTVHSEILRFDDLFWLRHKMRPERKRFDFRVHARVSRNTSETMDPVLAGIIHPILSLSLLHLWLA